MIKSYTIGMLLLFLTFTVQAQFTDDFSDGNFNASPVWGGDTLDFIINNGQLNSAGPQVTGSIINLSTPSTLASTAQWQFFANPKASTTSGNYIDVYLISDSANLKGNNSGYFVRIGDTDDDVCLYLKQSGIITKIIDGPNTTISSTSNNPTKIKVKRSSTNDWTLDADFSGTGNSYVTQGTVNDATINSSTYFGVLVKYSASNYNKYFFDDFIVGVIVIDTIAPQIASVTVLNSNSIDVFFNESVQQISAETISNYSVNNIGQPQTALRDAGNLALVHLSFGNNFPSGVTDTLTVNNVKDIADNTIAANSQATFIYTAPFSTSVYDIVINEIMADPDPQVGLPNAEYFELFNRSSQAIDMSAWTFADATSIATFGAQTILPGGYLIVSSTTNQTFFASFGTAYGLTSFPSLNNTGETLTLKDNTGKMIDQIFYDDTYYEDAAKSGGGWSIERINPNFTCVNKFNWKASVDASGGTPGKINSVNGNFSDDVAPSILHACPVSADSVQLFFSEAIADSVLRNISNYQLITSQSTVFPLSATPSSDLLSVKLKTPFNISTLNNGVEIKVNSSVSDCAGNAFGSNSTFIQWAYTAVANDVVINEVLSSPRIGGVEFIELYNRSDKAIDVTNLRIARISLTTGTPSTPVAITTDCYALLPQHYLVLTDDPDILKNQYTSDPTTFIQMNLPSLTDGEDIIALMDAADNVIDELHYYASWHYPLLNDLHGVSLERINPNRATQDKSNWHSASETSGFATPGLRNSQYSEVTSDGSAINIDPEIFSPDNDGTNDVTNITYHFDQPGFTANVEVFDDRGRLMTHLVKNELLGTDGTWSWNGITDKNEKARIGIYIIYMEAFDLKGDVKQYRKTCVLAAKL